MPQKQHKIWRSITPMHAGVLVGVGFVAAVDEIIFHQLLGWHHFYDRSTPFISLLSDGLLHAIELIFLVAGFTALINLQRTSKLKITPVVAGFLCGMGGFQLFDGIVNHKILRIHQIRYGVETLPYDIAWNLFAIILLMLGALLAYRYRRTHSSANHQ